MPSEIETGSFSLISCQHAHVAEVALAEVEAQVVPEHEKKALVGGLVEAELLLQAFDEFGIEPLCTTIFGVDIELPARLQRPARAEVAAGRAGNARGRPGVVSGQLGDDAFDRPAGRELHHDERYQHDPEDGRDHEEKSADDVGGHACNPIVILRCPRAARASKHAAQAGPASFEARSTRTSG